MSKIGKIVRGSWWLILGWSLWVTGCPDSGEVIEMDYSGIPTLKANEEKIGSIEEGRSYLYKFSPVTNKRYRVTWEDAEIPTFKASHPDAVDHLSVKITYGNDHTLIFENGETYKPRQKNFVVEHTDLIIIEVKAFNPHSTGSYSLKWNESTGERDIYDPPEVTRGSSSIVLKWEPPAEVSYQNIYRMRAGEDPNDPKNWVWIGDISRKEEETLKATDGLFNDYYSQRGVTYQYQIDGAYFDKKLKDWITSETMVSDPVEGAAVDEPEEEEVYQVEYDEKTGVMSFTPPLKKRDNKFIGDAVAVLEIWDEINSSVIYEDLYEKDIASIRLDRSMFESIIPRTNMRFWFDIYPAYKETKNGLTTVMTFWSNLILEGDPVEKGIIIPFVDKDAVITGVTVSAAAKTVSKGETLQFSAAVTGTGGTPSQAVDWTVNSKISSISPAGLLTVSPHETAAVLTVTATAKGTNKSGAAAVTVADDAPLWTITGVSVAPETAHVIKGKTQQFSAEVIGDGSPPQEVTWTVNSSVSSISPAGLLTVSPHETAAVLTVTATAKSTDIAGMAAVTVADDAPLSITVSPSEIEVHTGGGYVFTASQEVTWTVEGHTEPIATTIYEGWLWVGSNETASILTVKATSKANSDVSGTATVMVVPTVYRNETPLYPTATLTEGRWHGGYFGIGSNYFYFYAEAGSSYDIYWDDRDTAGTSTTGDITVTAEYWNGSTQAIPDFDFIEGYPLKGYLGKNITPIQSGDVVLRVDIDDISKGGTYRIRYDKQ